MASRAPAPRFLDLGALEIERAGITHRPGGAALGRLLSRLLISHGRRVETDELVDAVWGDRATAASLGAHEAPRLTELYGLLHARRGDHEIAVRFLSGARAQHRRAARIWPPRSSTTAVLEEAARRLGAAAYERAWQDGAGLQLADIPRSATG